MSHGMSRAKRLEEMKRLYVQRAFSDIEMAERLGVDRTTAYRDRIDLETEYSFIQDDNGWWKIDRTRLISEVKVNLHEALMLYLAAQRASRQARLAQPHLANALEKLATALKQPMTARLVRSAGAVLAVSNHPEQVKVLETVTRAWAEQYKVRITHQALHARQPWVYTVSPYLIEPSLWSDGTYLIGYSNLHKGIATFKIERITEAVLTGEAFNIPESFDDQELLKYAWGIWYGEKKPEKVVLRFLPGEAARRLKESIWHPTQKITDNDDGSCVWTADIAEWREITPWVRGWGADVEVLEPPELRDAIMQEAARLAQLYSLTNTAQQPERLLWAKTDKVSLRVHRLLYHLLDVGQVTLSIWRSALPAETRRRFADWLGMDEAATGQLLAFWGGLHDLGKAAPGFQRKYAESIPSLQAAGFVFPEPSVQPARHGAVSCWALQKLLVEENGLNRFEASQIGRALGGHHGAWPTASELGPILLKSSDQGDSAWDAARQALVAALRSIFQPPQSVHLPADTEAQNAFLTLLSGLVSTADWIGSMEKYFPYVDEILPLEQYAPRASRQADAALQSLGWVGWMPEGKRLSFKEMFPAISPNDIQQTVIARGEELACPALVILEAPTGCGKTEAALYLADTWLQAWQGRGLYIAMPTQATSNQMYKRVTEFLLRRYPQQELNLHLVHGAALLAEPDALPSAIAGEGAEQSEDEVRARTWFLPRKRTLLAPFGVGTVDQALMSVLQTRHFFVRLFGLGQKVVVFDEVHAYDTYMSTLFQQLLRWLRAIGTSVVLLSATLPEKTRHELAAAWLGEKDPGLPSVSYPRLTVISQGTATPYPLPIPEGRTIVLERISPDLEILTAHLADTLRNGGCAAIICNRVKRAQEIYLALKEANIVPADDLILFHARFPFAWREDIEEKVLKRFGKYGVRPHKAIVVATQVIEQSLDLDFDYMVSDLAPVDLLLQRAGRLHRHPLQHDAGRPAALKAPRLALTASPERDGLPDFGADARVYDRSVLLRTWLVLRGRDRLSLPEDTTSLIEAVYADRIDFDGVEPDLVEAIQQASEKSRRERASVSGLAKSRMVSRPGDEDLLADPNQSLEEEDVRVNQAFRALTRLTEPGVSLICLHQTADGLTIEPDGTGAPLDLDRPPMPDLVRELLRRAVSVQQRDVVDYFLSLATQSAWKESPALRYHHLAVFDEQGRCPLNGTPLTLLLSRETGLEIQKEAL